MIRNKARQGFAHGNSLKVKYDRPPHGLAKIVEIRQESEDAAVVQWLYSLAEARANFRITSKEADKWQQDELLESDHFDIIFGGNLKGLKQQRVVSNKMF